MKPIETVKQTIEALGRRDTAGVLQRIDAEVIWRGPPSVPWGGVHLGHEGVKAFFSALGENFEPQDLTIREHVATGDRVITVGAFSGKGRKSGKPASTDFCWVWQVKDGKISAYQGLFDTATIAAALA